MFFTRAAFELFTLSVPHVWKALLEISWEIGSWQSLISFLISLRARRPSNKKPAIKKAVCSGIHTCAVSCKRRCVPDLYIVSGFSDILPRAFKMFFVRERRDMWDCYWEAETWLKKYSNLINRLVGKTLYKIYYLEIERISIAICYPCALKVHNQKYQESEEFLPLIHWSLPAFLSNWKPHRGGVKWWPTPGST